MKYRIECQPGYSYLEVELNPGDSIASESGSMAWMDPGVEMETSTRGGVFAGLKRSFLSGESFFQNTYTSEEQGSRLALAPGPSGAIVALELNGEEVFLQKGAYLASIGDIKIDTKFDGLRGFFNEGLFILKCSGTGTLFFNAFGDIQQVSLSGKNVGNNADDNFADDWEEAVQVDGDYTVDNGYAVAWDPSLNYRLTTGRKIRSFLFGDQIMLRFSGEGRVWVQSRSPQAFASWIHPFRRVKSKNNN